MDEIIFRSLGAPDNLSNAGAINISPLCGEVVKDIHSDGPQPIPRRLNDQLQILKFGRPSKLALDLLRAGDQHRRIACATLPNAGSNVQSSSFSLFRYKQQPEG